MSGEHKNKNNDKKYLIFGSSTTKEFREEALLLGALVHFFLAHRATTSALVRLGLLDRDQRRSRIAIGKPSETSNKSEEKKKIHTS